MANENPLGAVVRGALQTVSEQYKNRKYVHDLVFPIIDNLNRKTKVLRYNKAPWFRDEAGPRPPKARAPHGNYSTTEKDINTTNYSFSTDVAWEEQSEARKPLNLPTRPRVNAIKYINNKIDLKKEITVANIIQTSQWSGVAAGGEDANGNWGHATAASDTFIEDIVTRSETIHEAIGELPNTLLVDYKTWFKLVRAPALLNLINPNANNKADLASGRKSLLDTETIGGLIRIPRIIIAVSIKNTAPEQEDETASDAWTPVSVFGNPDAPAKGMAFLYYSPMTPGREQVSPGYQYRLKQDNGRPRLSTSWKDFAHHSDWYDTGEDTEVFQMAADAGFLWKDTISD